jgi:hypothetical protein
MRPGSGPPPGSGVRAPCSEYCCIAVQGVVARRWPSASADSGKLRRQSQRTATASRQEWVHEQTSRYEAALRAHDNEVVRHNSRIAQIASGLRHRNRESVQWYLELALSRTLIPAEVPHVVELAYSPQGEQAVVRFELPSVEVIPVVGLLHIRGCHFDAAREETS